MAIHQTENRMTSAAMGPTSRALRARGRTRHLTGLAAEARVADHFRGHGRPVVAERWRGTGGEIDLIVEDGNALVFVEVKQAPRAAWALERVTPRQQRRIMTAATEFMGQHGDGLESEARFDIATVDGSGRIDVIENAFGAF